MNFLNTKIAVKLAHICLQLGIGKTVNDLAMFDNIKAICDR
jgi:hypothetical protein